MVEVPLWAWVVFAGVLFALLVIDLIAHRGGRESSHKAAVVWSIIWVSAGLAFAGFVWAVLGGASANEYLAAYLLEKGLSLDNLFVFLIIFRSLSLEPASQRKVLSWGIFGALVFRGIFIFMGIAAMERYEWVKYIFGAILIYAAIHALREDPAEDKESSMVNWLSRHLPITREVGEHQFTIVKDGKRFATPLLLAVCAVELTDIVFAIDSVPAALAVSREEFVVYSSNAFAILGLRSLFLVLEGTISQLRYLHYGLAVVLAFAGVKIIASEWIHLPALISVAIIVVSIGAAAWASVIADRRDNRRAAANEG